jgi:cation-transporting P-type ATPase F
MIPALPVDCIRNSIEGSWGQGFHALAADCHAEARCDLNQKSLVHNFWHGKLIFKGLQALMGPPRPESKQAVAACQNAGIQVKMITGDHALTAAANIS